jgi:hypothetical protein
VRGVLVGSFLEKDQREREWRGLLQGFLNYAQDLHGSSSSFFQALKDKGERGML